MDWLAMHLLPPPKPIGFNVRGHDVTGLDLSLVAIPTVTATALYFATGDWVWYDRQVGGLFTLENATGVKSDLR